AEGQGARGEQRGAAQGGMHARRPCERRAGPAPERRRGREEVSVWHGRPRTGPADQRRRGTKRAPTSATEAKKTNRQPASCVLYAAIPVPAISASPPKMAAVRAPGGKAARMRAPGEGRLPAIHSRRSYSVRAQPLDPGIDRRLLHLAPRLEPQESEQSGHASDRRHRRPARGGTRPRLRPLAGAGDVLSHGGGEGNGVLDRPRQVPLLEILAL